MKNKKLFFPALLLLTALNGYAQEFTLTTTSANTNSSKCLMDLPSLTGNPNAIILATPLGSTATMNPHPVGAWYYSGKWNIFNCDQSVMPLGLTYKVQYFTAAGANQFLHLVTPGSLGAEGSYIDNVALNNHPNVQFAIFQNHSPDIRQGSHLNPYEAKKGYSTSEGKWYITNVAGQPLLAGAAYNIIISSAGSTVDPPVKIDKIPVDKKPIATTGCNCPTSLPPNGQAKGDLAGNYPDPMVVKLLNRPLSNTPPTIGQILKWNGTEWAPVTESAATYTAGLGLTLTGNQFSTLSSTAIWNASQLVGREIMTTEPIVGQVLKWGGGSWYPADDNVGTGGSGGTTYTAGLGIILNGTQISANTTFPMWNANKLVGRDVLTTEPTVGQVLKWGGAAWYPADDKVGTTIAKPSVIFFNQTINVDLIQEGVFSAVIPGMDNQSFTLPQPARIVFNTAVFAAQYNYGVVATSGTYASITVEILNASNTMIGLASNHSFIAKDQRLSMNSVGTAVLPAGTYHTRVTLSRFAGGGGVIAWAPWINNSAKIQGGQMIIEIFPD